MQDGIVACFRQRDLHIFDLFIGKAHLASDAVQRETSEIDIFGSSGNEDRYDFIFRIHRTNVLLSAHDVVPVKKGVMPVMSNSLRILGGMASTMKGASFAWRALSTETRMPMPVLSI
ncbi:hypothetical protein D3C84_814090 [compost metagenome]